MSAVPPAILNDDRMALRDALQRLMNAASAREVIHTVANLKEFIDAWQDAQQTLANTAHGDES